VCAHAVDAVVRAFDSKLDLTAHTSSLVQETPLPVLLALAEREAESGKLKHPDVFQPLPPLLKRLCWEADWDVRVQNNSSSSNEEATASTAGGTDPYWSKIKSTLLYEAVEPSLEMYYSNPVLVEAANHPFAITARERRVFTKQRRALTSTAVPAAAAAGSTATTPGTTTGATAPSGLLRGGMTQRPGTVASAAPAGGADDPSTGLTSAGRAVAQLRGLLVDTTLGSAAAFRPKLLYCVLSMCMARHGSGDREFMGGAAHLHCTLVADILLSAGGPLPKAYHPLLSLAQILDECVQEGNIGDAQLAKVQAALKDIVQVDEDVQSAPSSETSATATAAAPAERSVTARSRSNVDEATSSKPDAPSNSLVRQLNRIITTGLAAMKEADPQSLFLNPVTDAIAPGYSKMILKPMSIVTMERKVQKDGYGSVNDWKQDVELMFKNCVDYNRGPNGQWFRGEANRQGKVFREEIFPVARRTYQVELAKRAASAANEGVKDGAVGALGSKRPGESQGPAIAPLPASAKKRKKDTKDEYLPSMPALACMLLADPVRPEQCCVSSNATHPKSNDMGSLS
jgi:Bromodomain